jgi:hypothetical protein
MLHTNQSPTVKKYKQFPVTITLDTGAETSMVKASFANYIDAPIQKTSQDAMQTDGVTPLDIVGELHVLLSRGSYNF